MISEIMGRLMSPNSSSTLIHQAFSSRDSQQSKCIDRISYYSSQYMHALLYLLLCLVRDGRLSMIGLVYEHSVDNSTTIPYGGYSDVTQFLLKQTWVGIIPLFLVFPSSVFLAVMHLPHNHLRLSSTDFFFRWSLILDPELIIPKKSTMHPHIYSL